MALRKKDQLFLQEGVAKAAAMLRAVGNEHRLLVLCMLIEQGETAASTWAYGVFLEAASGVRRVPLLKTDLMLFSPRRAYGAPAHAHELARL